MKPTGDFAQDFMDNFRTFFDATADRRACKYYDERALLSADRLAVLQAVANSGGRAVFKFFSPENAIATRMTGVFLQENTRADEMNGFRAYKITKIGRAAIAKAEART